MTAFVLATALALGAGAGSGPALAGAARGPDGAPLSGATVRAVATGPPGEGTTPVVVATREDGAFAIETLAGERFAVRIEAPGLAPATRLDVEPGSDLDLRLEPGVALVGRVRIAGSGEPIAGAVVRALEPGADRDDLAAVLHGGATLAFKLVDGDGNVVAPEAVRLEIPGDPRATRYARKDDLEHDDDGRYRFRAIPSGTYDLRVEPEDHVEIDRKGLRLPEGGVLDLGTLAVEPGRRIAGRLHDADGEPLGDTHVGAQWRGPRGFRTRISRTKADGTFSVGGLPEDVEVELSFLADGFVAENLEGIAAGTTGLDVAMERVATVAGTVERPDGEPATAFEIRTFRKGEDDRPDQTRSYEDPDGRFELAGLDVGTYTVEARARGFAPARRRGVEVGTGKRADAGRLVLREGVTLRGHVVEEGTGTPIAGAAVTVVRPALVGFGISREGDDPWLTASDGAFEVRGLEPGRAVVGVEHPDFAAGRAEVVLDEDAPPEPIEVRLSSGGTLTGTVRDADHMHVAGTLIAVMRTSLDVKPETVDTNAEGVYRLEHLPAGAYVVTHMRSVPNALGGMRSDRATVENGKTTVLDFDERAKILVSGVVLLDTEPLPGVQIMTIPNDAAPEAILRLNATSADDMGRYELGFQAPGSYLVMISRNSSFESLVGSVTLDVPDAPELERDLVVSTRSIAGRLTADDGAPIAGARVMARLRDRGSPRVEAGMATSDTDGRYVVTGLEGRAFVVTAQARGFAPPTPRGVTLPEDGIATGVDLVMEHGSRLSGTVVDAAGRPVARAMVSLSPPGGADTIAPGIPSDRDGRFGFDAAPDGPVDVIAIARGLAPGRTPVAGEEREGIVVTLGGGGSLKIVAVDGAGAPVPGVQVALHPTTLDVVRMSSLFFNPPAPTGDDGATSIAHLAAGAYEIRVSGRDDVAAVRADVVEGSETTVTLRLP